MFNLDNSGSARESNKSLAALDLQYEICSQFLRVASGELLRKELQLMQQSSQLIEKVADCLPLKDVSTTQQSFTIETSPDSQETIPSPSRSRLLLRKSQSTNCTLKRSDGGMAEAMEEVRRCCSSKTITLVMGMAADARRSRQKVLGYDRLYIFRDIEKRSAAKLRTIPAFNKKKYSCTFLLIRLKKKLQDLQQTHQDLEQQMAVLSFKSKESKTQSQTNLLRSSRSSEFSSKGPGNEELLRFLEQKEKQVWRKERELKGIKSSIQASMEAPLQQGCPKCCQLLKRIKDSVMRYRQFLEEEASMAQSLLFLKKSVST